MSDVPEAVMITAEELLFLLETPEQGPYLQYQEADIKKIADAIMAERESCAKIADEWAQYMVWVDGKPKKLLNYTDAADAIR